MIKASELILNSNGSIYHLNLSPEHIANKIITVGDQDRVDVVTKYFDTIEFTLQKREFRTTTGVYKGTRMTVISTGIGTDNIDIVVNELDALVNIDLNTRQIKENKTLLEFYRIGTSGSLREDIPEDSFVMSAYGFGLDNVLHFYQRQETEAEITIREAGEKMLKNVLPSIKPYASTGSEYLMNKFNGICIPGITISASGFYGPQGRELRLKPNSNDFLDALRMIKYNGFNVTNFEMETSAIYGLANLLGHKAMSLNAIIANRATGRISKDGYKAVDNLIQATLDGIAQV